MVARYRDRPLRRYFRTDAAFATPEIYEFLEAEGYAYAIHLPTNAVLQEQFLRGSTMNRLRRVTGQSSATLSRIWKKLSGGWAPYLEDPTSVEDLSHQMLSVSIPSFGFFFMLALATVIVTIGLAQNSGPTIIGAMIIAPLMAPIMSLSFGLATFDKRLIRLSVVTIAAGTILVVAIAYIGIPFFGLRVTGSEILSRTEPTLLDLAVAFAAGGAAAFAYTRRSIANSIAGVAIAVALVPPLAVSGIGLALGLKATTATGVSLREIGLWSGGAHIAAGAFILFLANLIGIISSAMLVFIFQRYGQWKKSLLFFTLFMGLSLLLVEPLNQSLHELYVKHRVLRLAVKINAVRPDLLSGRSRIRSVKVYYRNGLLHISINAIIPNDLTSQLRERVDRLREIISADIGEPVVLEIDAVPVEFIHITSKPAKLPKALIKPVKPGEVGN